MDFLKSLMVENKPSRVATRTANNNVGVNDVFADHFASPSKTRDSSLANRTEQAAKLSNAMSKVDSSNLPAIDYSKLPSDDTNHDSDHAVDNPNPDITKDLTTTGDQEIRAAGKAQADWMGVDQLPGYMQNGIKTMGRVVFKTLTKTRLEDIGVLANLGGHGPTEKMQINAVAHHARTNATSTKDLAMQFGEMIPGYEPDAKLYMTPHDTYLVVRDEMGQYIYSWETKDTKDAFVKKIE